MKFNLYTLPFLLALLIGNFSLQAQTQTPLDQALRFVEENQVKWNFTNNDLRDLTVSDLYPSSNGVYHVILQQTHRGISINNALLNVTIPTKGDAYTIGTPRFIQDAKSKVNAVKPSLSAAEALEFAITYTASTATRVPPLIEQVNEQSYIFNKGDVSQDEIPVDLKYRLNTEGEIILCWSMVIKETNNSDWWEMYVDAKTGELVHKHNYTVTCQFHNDAFHNHDTDCGKGTRVPAIKVKKALAQESTAAAAGEAYRVFPFPGESPAHSSHELVIEPAHPDASPFGWHDTNGIDGPEFTITRGNNVHAFQDQDGDNAPQGDEPDGGTDLQFDFPYDVNAGVNAYTDAATVNLFYSVNAIHDFTHQYGFDEAAGNFQARNYVGAGQGGDPVIAQSQDGFLTGSVNNANFGTPSDGASGTMQMFVWNRNVGGGEKFLEITAPASVAGFYSAAATEAGVGTGFGPAPPVTPISAKIVEVKDKAFDPFETDGCEEFINAAEINGNIALIDRGGCSFESKAIRAEAAGAIAVIICNFEDEPEGMAGVPGNDPTIPTIMLGSPDCQAIRVFAETELEGSIGQPVQGGPEYLDGDFDNGIIAHEFAHGISNRLTGGPSNAGCLGNQEGMGEGWSDFFGLAMTVKDGDTGEMRRGVGTFVSRQENDGRGIRSYPYSTDMAVNPLTYIDVAGNVQTHAVGTVWCTMIWDLYWALVDKYGFDPDLTNGDKGNNIAVHLVMEGMKQQPCSPGFQDGRDAIIKADLNLYAGVNECLINEVFARRGLGYDADQNTSTSASDGVSSFRNDPYCSQELEIKKTVTKRVDAGDQIDVRVVVRNYKPETLTGIVVSDELLPGLSYVAGSGTIDGVVQGDLVTFDIGNLEFDEAVILTYKLATDPNIASISQRYYDCESNEGWFADAIEDNPINWQNNAETPHTGNRSWKVDALPEETRQWVFMGKPIKITGTKPVVRFFHSYNTQAGIDGGITQVSIDENEELWLDTKDDFLRAGYNGPLDYSTFVIPNQSAYSGDSEGFIESYIDLTPYMGEDLLLRFNFATDEGTSPTGSFWAVDDIEFMDMVNYNGEVVLSYDQGDNITAKAEDIGTVVLGALVGTNDLEVSSLKLQIFPNPASDWVNVQVSSEVSSDLLLSVVTIDGKEVLSQKAKVNNVAQTVQVDVSDLAPGFYFVKATSGSGTKMEKIVIE